MRGGAASHPRFSRGSLRSDYGFTRRRAPQRGRDEPPAARAAPRPS